MKHKHLVKFLKSKRVQQGLSYEPIRSWFLNLFKAPFDGVMKSPGVYLTRCGLVSYVKRKIDPYATKETEDREDADHDYSWDCYQSHFYLKFPKYGKDQTPTVRVSVFWTECYHDGTDASVGWNSTDDITHSLCKSPMMPSHLPHIITFAPLEKDLSSEANRSAMQFLRLDPLASSKNAVKWSEWLEKEKLWRKVSKLYAESLAPILWG